MEDVKVSFLWIQSGFTKGANVLILVIQRDNNKNEFGRGIHLEA